MAIDRQKLRIAIFQYDLPLQSYSRDLATKLHEMGATVEFFGFKLGDREFVSHRDWKKLGIAFHRLDEAPGLHESTQSWARSVQKKLKWRWERRRAKKLFGRKLHFINRTVLLESYRVIKGGQFDLFIGIEKQGLIWAGMLSSVLNVPYLYYSLELYLEDNQMMAFLRHFRESEIHFHRKASATIIQDPFRAKALRSANNVSLPEVFLPVSVRGPANIQRTAFLKERLNLEGDPVILLYFGGISESRLCHTLIEASDFLPKDYVVVFHGYPEDEEYFLRLKRMAKDRPVLFSDADLEESEIDPLLASADIGIALYLNDNANDRLTAFSSQKIALFCRNGLPFIGNRNESYEALFQRFPCGEMASTPEEIAAAAVVIYESYDKYRDNCYSAFSEIYNLDEQFLSLQEYISGESWRQPQLVAG